MKETKELLHFIFGLCKAAGLSLQDGSLNVLDLGQFLGPLASASSAFLGANMIPTELAHLSEAQQAELFAWCKEDFDLPEDGIEMLVEKAMDAGFKILSLIESFKK